MAVEDSVAQDQLRAFIERIERMEEEKSAIGADIKEIYTEAKGNGFDTKILRKIVTIRKQDANERMEQEALLDLYMSALGMGGDVSGAYTQSRRNAIADDIDEDLLETVAETAKTPEGRKALMDAVEAHKTGKKVSQLRADPALAIVEPAILESKMQKVQTAQTEPQPAPPAGSDLTVPPSPQGQVAQIPAAVEAQRATPVTDVGGGGEAIQPGTANETTAARMDVRDNSKGPDQSALPADPVAATTPQAGTQAPPVDTIAGSSNGRTAAFDAVNAGSSPALASKYADPGVVVWESFPPEGVVQSEYSKAFGTLGQDVAVIEDDLSRLAAAPIQKIGNVILDGWARYNKARGMATEVLEDGVTKRIPVEYQVVQYDGSDPLLDCIRWNVGGRILSNPQKQTVVNRLCAIEPKRKAEIIKAVAEMAI